MASVQGNGMLAEHRDHKGHHHHMQRFHEDGLDEDDNNKVHQMKTEHDDGQDDQVTHYVAAHPKRRTAALAATIKHGHPTKITAAKKSDKKTSWQQKVSLICMKLLWKCDKPLSFVGFLVEWSLNFFALNGSLCTLPYRCIFHRNELVFPQPETSDYHTIIWHLDPRRHLYTNTSAAAKANSTKTNTALFPAEGSGSKSAMDVCIMASKLAYENELVVQKVVEEDWNMHFVHFYECWNEYQKKNNTQVYIFTDKKQDANAVVVAWRGTEAFNAYDWSTDIDFSWVRFQNKMGVHLGFLEALGLSTSGLSDEIIANDDQKLAYDDITKKVAEIIHDNPDAKVFITGHSLGGALATLYGAMLFYNAEHEITDKLAAIYTYGQPRVGDKEFAKYGETHLKDQYVRVVYCNDIVPRVPFDNEIFEYKHIGECSYYDSVYNGLILQEEPYKNFFAWRFFRLRMNALWELIQSAIILSMEHGHDYKESLIALLLRFIGLFVPGLAAHSPINYVNAVRLGPYPLARKIMEGVSRISENLKSITGVHELDTHLTN
ncbi:unnamed protein product [Sphagnum compactum]